MKIIFLVVLILATFALTNYGCGISGGAVVTTICNTVDQICTYKGLLCSVQSSTKGSVAQASTSNVSLESFYRSKLVELAESLKVQAQPVSK
jgi:hypothetical protein